jgi:hypothetical protein
LILVELGFTRKEETQDGLVGNGNIIATRAYQAEGVQFDLSHLSAGVYYVQMVSEVQQLTSRIVIQH